MIKQGTSYLLLNKNKKKEQMFETLQKNTRKISKENGQETRQVHKEDLNE